MKPKLGLGNRELLIACLIVGPVASLAPGNSVSGQTIQFFPIRTAPLGSPVGTIGDPVTPTFNEALNCWEVKIPGSVEVDIDVQAFDWGLIPGAPSLGAVQATVNPAGYNNGVGAPLNPKGWPASPSDGAYQAISACANTGDPCDAPFNPGCPGPPPNFCVRNDGSTPAAFAWVFPAVCTDLPAIATLTLDYAWATVDQVVGCSPDQGEIKTFGGLILEVPVNAAGTYVIALNPGPAFTFLGVTSAGANHVTLHSACITIIEGACCVDTDSDGHRDTCHDDGSESECGAADGLFLGDAVPCTGIVGACCLDGDGDGIDGTCLVIDSDCCDAQGGSFLGAGTTCSNTLGACTLDSDGDGFQDTCRVMDQTCCDARNGTFRGAGSLCNTILGACCLDFDRTCVEIDLANCVEQNGRFQGLKTVCRGDEDENGSDDACGEVIPAVSEWGLIILALSLLVGIKIYFARRRPGFRA